jgi:hypothetical protein
MTAATRQGRRGAIMARHTPQQAPLPPGAACAGMDPAVFFPEDGDDSQAKAICSRCPIRQPCLARAIARGEKFGVWGGENLEALHRPTRRTQPAPDRGLAAELRRLPPMDKAARLARLYAEHRTTKATAAAAGLDPATVRFYLDLLELHPDAQDRVRSGALTPARAVAAVRSTRNTRAGCRIPRAWERAS